MAKRNEVVAGLVVLVSLLALGFGLLMLVGSSGFFSDVRTVIVQFPDVGGGRDGDPVTIAGKQVGKVVGSRFARMTVEVEDPRSGETRSVERVGVELELQLQGDVEVPIDSTIRVVESLTGSRVISIAPGVERDAKDEEKLRGERGKGFADFADMAADFKKPIEEVAAAARLLLDDLRALVREVDAGVDADVVGRILTRVETSTTALEALLTRVDGTVERLEPEVARAIAAVARAAESADRLISSTEPKLSEVLAEAKRITTGLGDLVAGDASPVGQTVAKIGSAADTLREMLGGFDETGKGTSDLVARIRPKVTEILDSLAVTGTNLKAASEDLRAHPWKLLNAPDMDDQRVQVLFNAARNFNAGAESTDRAARELTAALERGAPAEEIAPLIRELSSRYESFGRAEEMLWEALREK